MTPENHTIDDILAALRMGIDYVFTIKLRALEVKVRPLSLVEHVNVVNDVQAEMSKKPSTSQNSLTESSLLAARILELASTDPLPGAQPRLPAALLERMTNDEVASLHKAYIAGCDILDPSVEELTEDRLMELVEAAKKNDGALAGLPSPHLAMLVRFLIKRAG